MSAPVGISNPGNLCYMNSVLQLLYTIKPLNKYIQNFNKLYPNQFLIQYINRNSYNIRELISYFNYEQYDAHEALIYIINKLHEILKIKNKSIIKNIFQGSSLTKIICSNCNNTNKIKSDFYCLSVPITDSLTSSLKKYIKSEIIENYKCDNCNKETTAEKYSEISKLPEYLFIHILRFNNIGRKNNSFINCPNKLSNYILQGAIQHSGPFINSGHFISNILHDNNVYTIDDDKVYSGTNLNQGYILLYKNVSQ